MEHQFRVNVISRNSGLVIGNYQSNNRSAMYIVIIVHTALHLSP